MADPLEFDEKWRALRERFIARLDERHRNIQDAWKTVRAGTDVSGQARNLLFHQVHSLTGSGATFGYAALSEAARALEPMLDPVVVPLDQPLSDEALEQAALALALLMSELYRVNPALAP